jgi:predicted dehydrogenase/nucleoside-diphosphate-sugar epimerase
MTRTGEDAATDIAGSKASSGARNAGSMRRVALLGAGYIADWHAQALRSVADVELVAVCDYSLSRAQALAGKFGIPRTYASLEAMLAAEKLDAVHVLLPPDRHFAAAKTLLEAGVNVLLEKPMCDRAADCRSLAALAYERGLRLGVGHNFLFSEPYERLRSDLKSGVLGRIDDVIITWHKPLPQVAHGPFDTWMLRDPRNILIEIGSHSVAHMLDLVGEPEEVRVHPSNPTDLPTGRRFYRRWQVNASKGHTAVELRFSFVPGFAEYSIHVRGSLAAATVDFERTTYTLHQHRPSDPDFENYAMLVSQAKSLKRQARRTLRNYVESKLHLRARGNPYGESIARAMDAFYDPRGLPLDARIDGHTGATVIRLCEAMGALADLPPEDVAPRVAPVAASTAESPRILVLGGTGFIGKELVRQLTGSGRAIRLLVRSAASIPENLQTPQLQWQVGDLGNREDVLRAMQGVDCVFHLARANVKSWADYRQLEIEATRQVAECALEAGVKRFIYTGTIDSYYAGRGAGTITEKTPLDPRIERRNLYARAKAASEEILMRMHRERGLPLVIVRPGVVIGRGGSPFHWGVGMWWHDAVCQIWGDGNNKLALVLVDDVARGLIAAMETRDIEGRSFNLVGDPCLSAQEYLDELDCAGGIRIQRRATPIFKFYLQDTMKWMVKVAVRHPERRLPSYRDWESRTGRAVFDCTEAKTTLGWQPVSGRDELVRRGIEEPLINGMK